MAPATALFTADSERLGGRVLSALFQLTVTHPVATTWYLATRDLDADALYAGSPAYEGLIRSYSPIPGAAVLGGLAGLQDLTLEIVDALGPTGRNRRWSDRFVANVAGYAEPYDLLTLTVKAFLAWEGRESVDVLQCGMLQLRPDGYEWPATGPDEAPIFRLTFGSLEKRWRPIPQRVLTRDSWPHLPTASEGRPIPVWFGQDVTRPLIPLDEDGEKFLDGEALSGANGGYATLGSNRLWVIRQDPETERDTPFPMRLTGGGTAIVVTGDNTARASFNEVAYRFQIVAVLGTSGSGGFAASVALSLRRNAAGTPCVGSVSFQVVVDADGLPSDELVEAGAAGEMDAANVTSGTFATFTIPFQDNNVERAIYLPPDVPLWLVVKYGKDSGDMDIEVLGTGAAPGYMVKKDAAGGWVPIGKQKRRGPVKHNFTGIGYLRKALSDGTIVTRPPVKQRKKKGLYVGVVNDGGVPSITRGFMRFKISDYPGAVVSARLELYFINKASPAADVELREITDFTTLDPTDWDRAERATINAAIVGTSDDETRLSIDVTTRYNQAKTDALSHFALKLQYANEAEALGNGRWYLFGASGKFAPRLVVVISAGQDLEFSITYTAWALDFDEVDPEGHTISTLTFGAGNTPTVGPNVRLALTTDYTQLEVTGDPIDKADLVKMLLMKPYPIGLGLTSTEVDTAAFDTAATRLADWFTLHGGLTEPRDPREWIARLLRGLRAFHYTDQDGKETVYVDPLGGSGATPVRLVHPWEHGPLRFFPLSGAAGGALFPVTEVRVDYERDWLGLENPEGARSRAAEYEGFTILSQHRTDPPDAARQAAITAADARYGLRRQGGIVPGPTSESTYEFVPLEGLVKDASGNPLSTNVTTGVRLRDYLWDKIAARVIPAQVVEVPLPRFALGWRPMDEFDISDYRLPSAAPRVLLGEAALGQDLPEEDFYQATTLRCSVRSITLSADHGPEDPVLVTAAVLARSP